MEHGGTRRVSVDAASPGGGPHVVAGDVNGDRLADVVVGAGAGRPPHVRVSNGVTGGEICSYRRQLDSLSAFGNGFTGGVSVAYGH